MINGPLDDVPEVKAAAEKVLLLQRIQTGPPMIARMSSMHGNNFLSLSGRATQFTTNGVVNPTVAMRPGEVRRWRMVNADAIATLDGEVHHLAGDNIRVAERHRADLRRRERHWMT